MNANHPYANGHGIDRGPDQLEGSYVAPQDVYYRRRLFTLRIILRTTILLVILLPVGALIWSVLMSCGLAIFLLGPLFLLVLAIAILGGLVWFIIAMILRKHIWGAAMMVAIPIFMCVTALFVIALSGNQVEGNQRRGQKIAQAVKLFHVEHGQYPNSLEQLRPDYIENSPRYWFGLLPREFIYAVDEDGKPFLKFITSPFSARYYNFEEDTWEVDSL